MTFMRPQVFFSDYYEIDGPQGTEIVPCSEVEYAPTKGIWFDCMVVGSDGNWASEPSSKEPIPKPLADVCLNKEAWSIRKSRGWIGRMSAPGYLDCTDWIAEETEDGALNTLKEMYGCTICGEFEDECTCSAGE